MAHKVKVPLLGLSCLGNSVKCNNKMKLSVANAGSLYVNGCRVLTGFFCVIIFDSKSTGWTKLIHFGSIGEKRAPVNFFFCNGER